MDIRPPHPIHKTQTDLPVLKPFQVAPPAFASASQWLANLPPYTGILLFLPLLIWPFASHAAGEFTMLNAFEALITWIPFLFASGFLFNVLISLFSMLFGTPLERFWDWDKYPK